MIRISTRQIAMLASLFAVVMATEFVGSSLSLAFGGGKAATESIWVSKDDGGKSCEPESAEALEAGAAALTQAGVKVLESRKDKSDAPRAMVCGQPNGDRNSYRISRGDLSKAEKLGLKK